MKALVVGMTPIGVEVAAALSERGFEVTAVDRDGQRLAVAEERLDALFLEAHEGTEATLRDAGAGSADFVVYATGQDELNLFAAATARRLGATKALAMVRNISHLNGAPGLARNLHGVDFVLCPVLLTAAEGHRLGHAHRVLNQAQLGDNRIIVEEIPITTDDPVAGATIDRVGLPDAVRIVALVRDHRWVPAGPRERLQVGDRAILVGRRGAMISAEQRFHPGAQRAPRHAFLVGGGRIGLHIGRAFLAEGVAVTLVEHDRSRCEMRSRDLPEATILHADGTDVHVLQEEGAATADVLISGTQDDETNLVVSLLAGRIGTRHTVTLVHRTRNVEVYGHLGLPATVSRPLVAAQQAVRLASSGVALDVVEVAEGKLLALEIEVAEGCALQGRTVADSGLPADAIATLVLQRGQVSTLQPSTRLDVGDRLVIVAPQNRRKAVERLAEGRKEAR